MKEINDRLYCFVTADEELNYLGIFAFSKFPENGDLVCLKQEGKCYVVITENEHMSVDEFQVEEITQKEFDEYSNEWQCKVHDAQNIYNKYQDQK